MGYRLSPSPAGLSRIHFTVGACRESSPRAAPPHPRGRLRRVFSGHPRHHRGAPSRPCMWLTRSTSKTRHPRSHTSPGPHDVATPYPRTIHILRAERWYRGGPIPGAPRTPPQHPAGCGSICTDTRPLQTLRSPAVGVPELLVPGRRGVRSSARDPPSRPCQLASFTRTPGRGEPPLLPISPNEPRVRALAPYAGCSWHVTQVLGPT